jgi:hypothetical protein
MPYLGEYEVNDYLPLDATVHRFSSGAAYVPTAITYRIYKNGVALIGDTAMTNFDSETGLYFNRIQLTAALGFEAGKDYLVLIKATVDSVSAITSHTFRMVANRTIPSLAQITALTNALAVLIGAVPTSGQNAAAVAAALSIPTTSQISAAIGARQPSESYAAKGAVPTWDQFFCMILQLLSDRYIIGTTQTTLKLNGTDPAMTHTLDDSSDPTDVRRAT